MIPLNFDDWCTSPVWRDLLAMFLRLVWGHKDSLTGTKDTEDDFSVWEAQLWPWGDWMETCFIDGRSMQTISFVPQVHIVAWDGTCLHVSTVLYLYWLLFLWLHLQPCTTAKRKRKRIEMFGYAHAGTFKEWSLHCTLQIKCHLESRFSWYGTI